MTDNSKTQATQAVEGTENVISETFQSEEKILPEGTVEINAANDIVNIDGNTTITGKLHVTEEQTNDKTIVAQGTITDSGATLASHTHPGDSGGNTGSPN